MTRSAAGHGYDVAWRSHLGRVLHSDGDDYRRSEDRDATVERVRQQINSRGGTVLSVTLRSTPAREEDLKRREQLIIENDQNRN